MIISVYFLFSKIFSLYYWNVFYFLQIKLEMMYQGNAILKPLKVKVFFLMWWGISGRRKSKVLKQCVFLRRLMGTYNILEKISLAVSLSLCMKTNAQRVWLSENQTITPSKPGLELRSWLPGHFSLSLPPAPLIEAGVSCVQLNFLLLESAAGSICQ